MWTCVNEVGVSGSKASDDDDDDDERDLGRGGQWNESIDMRAGKDGDRIESDLAVNWR